MEIKTRISEQELDRFSNRYNLTDEQKETVRAATHESQKKTKEFLVGTSNPDAAFAAAVLLADLSSRFIGPITADDLGSVLRAAAQLSDDVNNTARMVGVFPEGSGSAAVN